MRHQKCWVRKNMTQKQIFIVWVLFYRNYSILISMSIWNTNDFWIFFISYFWLNFRQIGEGSKLENKYLKLFELSERMTSSLKNRRPNCDEILFEKHLWSLNLTELQNDSEFKSKEMQFSDNIFYSHFIKMKSEMSLNLSSLEINDDWCKN